MFMGTSHITRTRVAYRLQIFPDNILRITIQMIYIKRAYCLTISEHASCWNMGIIQIVTRNS